MVTTYGHAYSNIWKIITQTNFEFLHPHKVIFVKYHFNFIFFQEIIGKKEDLEKKQPCQTCPLAIAFDQILPPEISELSRCQFFDGIFRFEFWPMFMTMRQVMN